MVKARDLQRPKRFMSAFFLFLNDFRKKNQPRGFSNVEMVQKGAAVWRTLNAREKQSYEGRSGRLRERYIRDMKKYRDNLKLKGKKMGDENAHGSKVQKRNANRPKRALSAYLLFMQDFRKKNIKQNWDVTDVVKKGASVWRTLTSREKYPYEKVARKHHEKYHKKMERFRMNQKKQAAAQKLLSSKKKIRSVPKKTTKRRNQGRASTSRSRPKSTTTKRRNQGRASTSRSRPKSKTSKRTRSRR